MWLKKIFHTCLDLCHKNLQQDHYRCPTIRKRNEKDSSSNLFMCYGMSATCVIVMTLFHYNIVGKILKILKIWSRWDFSKMWNIDCALGITCLVGVGNIRAAITSVPHSISVSVLLVPVFHSLTVVQEVFNTCKPVTKRRKISIRHTWHMHSNNSANKTVCVCECVYDCEHFLTISIHVIIACIPKSVWISIPLVWILNGTAVIACITMAILITVYLIHIRLQPAIVLAYTHT